MQRRAWRAGLAVIFTVLALGYAGWSALRPPDGCYACRRAIHEHARTVALVNGHSRQFCCPACALSQHEQAGKPVAITRLTSYLTGKPLLPVEAYLVRGSSVNMCARTQEIIDAEKRPADLRYDRCAPSLIAFARQDEAAAFAREHGGEVLSFREVAAAFAK
jgi:hypothetical protein